MRRTWTGLGLGVALFVAPWGYARACSCGRDIVGAGRLYLGAGDVLPPDATGFPWFGPESLVGAPERVKLVRIDGKRRVPVKFTIVKQSEIEFIVPAQRLESGQIFEVTVRESDRATDSRQHWRDKSELPPIDFTTRVTIGAEPLRLTGVSLRVGEPTNGTAKVAASGSCWEEFAAVEKPLRVELPPELEPMRDYLLYTTSVDGLTWDHAPSLCASIDPGRTWAGEAGTDKLFAVCGPRDKHAVDDTQLLGRQRQFPQPGPHRVEVRVATPDYAQVLTTAAITVEFSCPAKEAAPAQPAASTPPPRPANEPAQQPEPPAREARGCAIGEPGFAWVLGLLGLGRRRRR